MGRGVYVGYGVMVEINGRDSDEQALITKNIKMIHSITTL
jgi:hypothetical protein